MKKTCLVLAAALAATAALSVPGPAAAAVTCSYDAGTHNVTINASGNNTTVNIIRHGAAIEVNGSPCGAADVNNTAMVKVIGSSGRQGVTIDFANGAFVPGFGADTGVAEIEFVVDLKIGTDSLVVSGSPGIDNFRIGADGINVNGDSDVDITMPNVEELTAYGTAGADTISGEGGLGTGAVYPNLLRLYGDDGNDKLTGGEWRDYLYGGNNNDTENGGDGRDYLYGNAGADTLNGGLELDTFYPGTENDTVNAGDGSDYIYTEPVIDGADVFNGGSGSDWVFYYGRASNMNLTIDGVANDGQSGENDNIKLDVERVTGGNGNDTITGSDADNQLDGNYGADTVHGGPGDDYVYGGCCDLGADQLYGDDGSDYMYGYDGADKLYGGTGRDYLAGGVGNDFLDGGPGDDTFYSEYDVADGADDVHGGSGEDYASYYRPTGDQTFTLGDNTANDGLAGEKDNIRSDVEDLDAGEGNDHITGNAGRNHFYGEGGNDVIDGKDGADDLEGYDGNDTLTGGDGEDYLYGFAGADSFKAQDGGYDVVYGGSDADTDVIVNKDSNDSINQIP